MKLVPNADGRRPRDPDRRSAPPYFVEEADHAIVLTLYGVRGEHGSRQLRLGRLARAHRRVGAARGRARARHGRICAARRTAISCCGSTARSCSSCAGARASIRDVRCAGSPSPSIRAIRRSARRGRRGCGSRRSPFPSAMRLKTILEERGARVVMTRTTADRRRARRPADHRAPRQRQRVRVDPSQRVSGRRESRSSRRARGRTSSARRASRSRAPCSAAWSSQMGLQDLGVNYDNLAVVRVTWYPAVLCEGAFLMMPDQEAALRTPEFQERYARGIADGLESYFRVARRAVSRALAASSRDARRAARGCSSRSRAAARSPRRTGTTARWTRRTFASSSRAGSSARGASPRPRPRRAYAKLSARARAAARTHRPARLRRRRLLQRLRHRLADEPDRRLRRAADRARGAPAQRGLARSSSSRTS